MFNGWLGNILPEALICGEKIALSQQIAVLGRGGAGKYLHFQYPAYGKGSLFSTTNDRRTAISISFKVFLPEYWHDLLTFDFIMEKSSHTMKKENLRMIQFRAENNY